MRFLACSTTTIAALLCSGLSACSPARQTIGASPRSVDRSAVDLRDVPSLGNPPVATPRCPRVTVTAPPAHLGFDPFYRKYVDAGGIAIVGSADVSDAAFRVAYYQVLVAFANRPCERLAIRNAKVHIAIIGKRERPTDIPEYGDLYEAFPGVDWNDGYAAYSATPIRPATTIREANLVGDRRDPWWSWGEPILVHELAHTHLNFGLESLAGGSVTRRRIESLYSASMQTETWTDTYATTNPDEFFAETSQSFFDSNLEAWPADGVHNEINTRRELYDHDPDVADFLDETWTGFDAPPTCSLDTGTIWQPQITPSDSECRFDRETLRPLPCEAATGDASNVDSPVSPGRFVVYNRRFDAPVRVQWIAPQGTTYDYGTVGPRQGMEFSTNTGHRWMITDARGTCQGVYRPTAPENWVFVNDSHPTPETQPY